MSVQYKTSDGWKNISSSSNNAVDTVADGNMSPVTSNAVYDALKPVVVTISAESGFTTSNETKCFKVGNLCTLSFIISGPIAGYTKLATGLPVPATVDGNNRIVNFSVSVTITGTGGLGREVAGEAYVDGNGALFIRGYNDVAGDGTVYGSVTYVCE